VSGIVVSTAVPRSGLRGGGDVSSSIESRDGPGVRGKESAIESFGCGSLRLVEGTVNFV
jgi:hypothetical protein